MPGIPLRSLFQAAILSVCFVMTARAQTTSDDPVALARARSGTGSITGVAVSVSDAVSAETISRSGSGDAASAMTRVTGASVVDGRYVTVRGLGDRYALAQINGSSMPSADPDRKAFQLDLILSSLIGHIVTIKTFTPDRPGSFSGGLVDVGTKDYPDRLTFRLSASASVNSRATFSEILSCPGGSRDWLGVDDGSREIPDALADGPSSLATEIETVADPSKAVLLDRAAKSFVPVMAPTARQAPLGRSLSVAIGNQARLAGRPLGYTASLTYGRQFSGYDDGTVGRWDLIGGRTSAIEELTAIRYFGPSPPTRQVTAAGHDRRGTDEVNWGGLVTVAFKPHGRHSLAATLLRSQSGVSEARSLAGYWVDLTGNSTCETRVLGYRERSLVSVQGKGEHSFGTLTLTWRASFARNRQDEPDLRYFSDRYTVRESGGGLDTLYQSPASLYPAPTRFFRTLEETTGDLALDVLYPFRAFSGLAGSFKVGVSTVDVDRDFSERRFEYAEGRGFRFGDCDGDVNGYFAAAGILDTLANGRLVVGNYIRDASSPRSNYTGVQSIDAVYAMVDRPVTRRLRVVGGARLETTDLVTVPGDLTLLRGVLDDRDWLHSLNVVYGIGTRANLRAAYSRTLARPTFRELAPCATFAFVGDYVFRGNARLMRTLITNCDLRWERFMRPGEIVAASLFFKERIRLAVYDLLGREVAVLVDGVETSGTRRVSFDAGHLATGVCVYRLATPGGALSRRMVLVR